MSHYMNHMQSYIYTGILGPQLALGATIYHRHVHLAIPRLSGSPMSCRSHYMNHMSILPFPDIRRPQWTPGATVYQCHVHLAILRVLGPHWATGATIWITHKWHVGWAIVDLLVPQWALRATIWTTCRSRYFQSFWVLSEPWEPIYINPM